MLPREDLLADSKIVNVRERFRREAKNGAKMAHDNIVRYLDHGEAQGNPFLVMELGKSSIGKTLRQSGALSPEEAATVVCAVTDALQCLHEKGSPHRDVKPDNVIQFDEGYKLGDLGIVKWSDFDPSFTTGGTITRASVQLGSWFYMAPEQQQDPHEAVPASDVNSLGVSWIEMLAGSVPSPQAVGARQYKSPDSPAVASLIERMVSYRPEDRASLQEIATVAQDVASSG